VVRPLQDHGRVHLRQGPAGVGYRPERDDREGLRVGNVRPVLPEEQRAVPHRQDPAALDGRHLADHDSAERDLAAGG